MKFYYSSEEERADIINNNIHLFLVEDKDTMYEKYLVFTDIEPIIVPTIEELVKQQGDKISILEEENETLRLELSITQDAVNELLFNTLNA